MTEFTFGEGSVNYSECGIELNLTSRSRYNHHINGKVYKVDEFFIIEAEKVMYEFFYNNEYDPKVLEAVADEDIEESKSWFTKKIVRHVSGYVRLKETKKNDIFNHQSYDHQKELRWTILII